MTLSSKNYFSEICCKIKKVLLYLKCDCSLMMLNVIDTVAKENKKYATLFFYKSKLVMDF